MLAMLRYGDQSFYYRNCTTSVPSARRRHDLKLVDLQSPHTDLNRLITISAYTHRGLRLLRAWMFQCHITYQVYKCGQDIVSSPWHPAHLSMQAYRARMIPHYITLHIRSYAVTVACRRLFFAAHSITKPGVTIQLIKCPPPSSCYPKLITFGTAVALYKRTITMPLPMIKQLKALNCSQGSQTATPSMGMLDVSVGLSHPLLPNIPVVQWPNWPPSGLCHCQRSNSIFSLRQFMQNQESRSNQRNHINIDKTSSIHPPRVS